MPLTRYVQMRQLSCAVLWSVPLQTKSGDKETLHNFPHNVGDEIVLYAKFIIEHYDHLPSRIIFGHAHERSWHQRVRHWLEALLIELSLCGGCE